MSNRSFVVVAIAVALLTAALVYIHRPRGPSSPRAIGVHGAP
jgi:hypothetical protein